MLTQQLCKIFRTRSTSADPCRLTGEGSIVSRCEIILSAIPAFLNA